MRQNLTVSLDKELIKKLRLIAAERSTSISGMLSNELQRIVERSEQYNDAKRRALAALRPACILAASPQPGMNSMTDKVFDDANILIYAYA